MAARLSASQTVDSRPCNYGQVTPKALTCEAVTSCFWHSGLPNASTG